MSSLKKKLCDPPAEEVAGNGDHEVCGYFKGARYAVDDITNESARLRFVAEVVDIEAEYMKARSAIAAETVARMKTAVETLLQAEYVKGGGDGL